MLNEILYPLFALQLIFSLIVCVYFVFMLGILWSAYRQTQKRKQLFKEMKLQYATGYEAVEVRYASEKRFRKVWKIFPWEGIGILVKTPQGIVFYGQSVLDKTQWEIEFDKANDFIFIGRVIWPNGLLAWLVAHASDETIHYFSSETGMFVFGSKSSTESILLKLKGTHSKI